MSTPPPGIATSTVHVSRSLRYTHSDVDMYVASKSETECSENGGDKKNALDEVCSAREESIGYFHELSRLEILLAKKRPFSYPKTDTRRRQAKNELYFDRRTEET